MIDIDELRRLAQEAMHPVTKGRWMRLFGERTVYDRMEDGCRGIPIVATDHLPTTKEAAYLDFIAAANPATISELLGRLEAAESGAAHQKALAESALRVAEGWERKCDSLRAKIEQMEQQEPVSWVDAFGEPFRQKSEIDGVASPLYALPGAKGE